MAYVCAKAANECLAMVYEFREKVDNKDFIDAIKQVKPKINYFTKYFITSLEDFWAKSRPPNNRAYREQDKVSRATPTSKFLHNKKYVASLCILNNSS
jgi:hypothetical protein